MSVRRSLLAVGDLAAVRWSDKVVEAPIIQIATHGENGRLYTEPRYRLQIGDHAPWYAHNEIASARRA